MLAPASVSWSESWDSDRTEGNYSQRRKTYHEQNIGFRIFIIRVLNKVGAIAKDLRSGSSSVSTPAKRLETRGMQLIARPKSLPATKSPPDHVLGFFSQCVGA
jgi:hypothetical protein